MRSRRVLAAVVIPNDWVIEVAPHNARYEHHLQTHRAVEAFRAYRELEIRDGAKKRLLRNGKVISRDVSPAPLPVRHQEETLPIAL